jgi:hypothetical protein
MHDSRTKTRRTPARVSGALVCACLCLTGAKAMTQGDSPALRTIERGAQSNIDSARQAVARTPEEWAALWNAHNSDKPAPQVDFDREMVVAVFMGSRPTGGYSVQIVSAQEQNGGLVISYHEASPRPGAITTQVLTFPYHIVAVSKHAGAVSFERK